MTTAETIKIIFIAFGAGLALPLALQLFLTLRSVQRAVNSTNRRVDEVLDKVESLVGHGRATGAGSPTTQALSTFGSALVPAVLAAVKAYRAERAAQAADQASPAASAETAGAEAREPSSKETGMEMGKEKENGHARV